MVFPVFTTKKEERNMNVSKPKSENTSENRKYLPRPASPSEAGLFYAMDFDSCWAMEARMVMSTSPTASMVLMDSFSNRIGIFSAFSLRI